VKKLCIFVAVLMIGAFVSTAAFGEEEKDEENTEMEKHEVDMKGPHKKGKIDKFCRDAVVKSMLKREMEVDLNGDVVVLSGNKLMKFDRKLNLVKEVEIDMDMAAIEKALKEMKENCPKCMKKHKDKKKDKDKEKH